MPTVKPRITITLTQEQYAVLDRLARLQGGSMSRIVVEFLREVLPVLERLADSLSLAMQAQGVAKGNLRRMVEQSEAELEGIQARVMSHVDLFDSALRQAVPAPHPVESSPSARGRAASGGRPRPGGSSPRPVITGATGVRKAPSKGPHGRPVKARGRAPSKAPRKGRRAS